MRKKTVFILLILFFNIFLSQCAKPPFMSNDYAQPKVENYYPKNLVVSKDTVFWVKFSESMDPEQTAQAFSFSSSSSTVPGVISWSDNNTKLTFTPSSLLSPNTKYTLSVSTSAEDKNGNDLKNSFIKDYSAVGISTDRPQLRTDLSSPYYLQSGVLPDTEITLVFDKEMKTLSVGTGVSISPEINFHYRWESCSVDGKSLSNNRLVITPNQPLTHGTTYEVTVNQSMTDIKGNILYEEKKIKFVIGAIFTQPKIVQLDLRREDNVDQSLSESSTTLFNDNGHNIKEMRITFDQEMDKVKFASKFNFSFPFQITWEPLLTISPGVYRHTVRIIPLASLKHGESYDVNLTTDLLCSKGNSLYKDYNFKFRVGNNLDPLRINQITINDGNTSWDVVSSGIITTNNGKSTTHSSNARPTITINFTETVDRSSFINYFSISPSVTQKNFSWSNSDKTVTITFGEDLSWHEKYELKFSSSIRAQSSQNGLDSTRYEGICFYLGNDYTRPQLSSAKTNRGSGDLDLVKNTNIPLFEKKDRIRLTFNKKMDITSLNEGVEIKNIDSGETLSFAITDMGSNTYLINTEKDFDSSAKYQLLLGEKIKDVQGNVLINNHQGAYGFTIDAENSKAIEIEKVCFGDLGSWANVINYTSSLLLNGTPFKSQEKILIKFNKQLDSHTIKQNIQIVSITGNTTVTIPYDIIKINRNETDSSSGTCVIIDVGITFSSPLDTIYKLTIIGGDSGVKDTYSNKMKENKIYYFKETH